jgi:hypothetical protein
VAAGTGVRVLVVDDNQDAADSLGELLALLGYRAEVAYDPAQALALASAAMPEVAILDIGLPGMDGFELGGRLRGLAGGAGSARSAWRWCTCCCSSCSYCFAQSALVSYLKGNGGAHHAEQFPDLKQQIEACCRKLDWRWCRKPTCCRWAAC